MQKKWKVSYLSSRYGNDIVSEIFDTEAAADANIEKIKAAGRNYTKEEVMEKEPPKPWQQRAKEAVLLYWKKAALVTLILISVITVWRTVQKSYLVVPAGNKAVVMVFGKVSHIAPEGLNFVWPWISTSVVIPTRIVKIDLKADAVSQDQQKVSVAASVQWLFKPDFILDTFTSVGGPEAVENSLMMPALNETLKSVTAKHAVGQILDRREDIKADIDAKFRQKMSAYKVTIVDIFLTDLRFDPEYEAAIEAKQVAEVQVKTAQNKANAARQQAQGEADAALIRASAEAKSKRLLSSTVSKAVLQLEWIKAWEKGGSQVPTFIAGGNTPFMLDLSKLKDTPVAVPAAETPAE